MLSSPKDWIVCMVVALAAYWVGQNNGQQEAAAALAAGARDALSSGTARSDVNTGIVFPSSHSFYVLKKPPMSLVGIGTRSKAILNIYSLGFYLSPSLKKKVDRDTETDACQKIMDATTPKAALLTFNMGIGPEKIAEALSGLGDDVDEGVKSNFKQMIVDGMGEGKMRKGESMTLEWKKNDIIAVTVRGTYIGEVKDEALAKGAIGLYLGPQSVSPSLKADMGCG